MKIQLLLVMVLLLAGVGGASADTLRCKGKLVSVGMTMETVRKHCGEPDSKVVEERPVRSKTRVIGTYQAEIWTYQRGSGKFPAVLEFDGEKLISLTYLER